MRFVVASFAFNNHANNNSKLAAAVKLHTRDIVHTCCYMRVKTLKREKAQKNAQHNHINNYTLRRL